MTDRGNDVTNDPLEGLVLTEPVFELVCSMDGGFYAGYQDGFSGSPKRELPPNLPKLFVLCYNEAYDKGNKERQKELDDKRVSAEIAQLEKEQGCCVGDEQHNHSDPAHEGGISTMDRAMALSPLPKPTEGAMENSNVVNGRSGFWKKALPIVAAGVAGMTVGGVVGLVVGRKQQIKKNQERDLGIGSNDQSNSTITSR